MSNCYCSDAETKNRISMYHKKTYWTHELILCVYMTGHRHHMSTLNFTFHLYWGYQLLLYILKINRLMVISLKQRDTVFCLGGVIGFKGPVIVMPLFFSFPFLSLCVSVFFFGGGGREGVAGIHHRINYCFRKETENWQPHWSYIHKQMSS